MQGRIRVEQIFLWLFVILCGGGGAGLYEMRVIVPLWANSPPESVWYWEAQRAANPQYVRIWTSPLRVGEFSLRVNSTISPDFYVYGVVAYTVARRTREIGLRMALGAQPRDILRLVLRQGLVPVFVGVVAGVSGALALSHVLSSMLYGVSATDPAAFAGVCALLTLVALLAAYIPARRASRIDPLVSLRDE
jgi:FtsX-like permease family